MRRKARSVARSQGTGDPDDLCQLGMEEAGRLAPEFQPDRGKTFAQFVMKAARGAMVDTWSSDLRERAMAHHMQRAAEHVLQHIDTGDYLAESEDVRKQRFDHVRLAVGAVDLPRTVDTARELGVEYDQARYRMKKALERVGERVKRGWAGSRGARDAPRARREP